VELKCQYHIGCHSCPLEKLKEEMRMFRQAITQFLVEPQTHISELRGMGYSLKSKIDEWYEPHTDSFKPEEE
jgi:hypothetical protein